MEELAEELDPLWFSKCYYLHSVFWFPSSFKGIFDFFLFRYSILMLPASAYFREMRSHMLRSKNSFENIYNFTVFTKVRGKIALFATFGAKKNGHPHSLPTGCRGWAVRHFPPRFGSLGE